MIKLLVKIFYERTIFNNKDNSGRINRRNYNLKNLYKVLKKLYKVDIGKFLSKYMS